MPGQAPVGDTVGASNSNSDDGSIIGCDPKDDDSFRLLQAVAAGASPPAPFGPDRGAIDAATSDDGAFSAVERLFAFVNGPTGSDNPQRQGLNSVLSGDAADPLNVFGGVPTIALDYSPLWDLNLGAWTEESVDNDYRSRMIDEFQILAMAEGGFITGPDGAEYGSTGIIVNCPIVMRLL